MQLAQPGGRLGVGGRPDQRLQETSVEGGVDLRQSSDRREPVFALEVVAGESPDVVQAAPLETDDPVALGELGVRRGGVLADHDRLVEPRRRQSIRSMLEANSRCSLVATLPETKMPRWPILS